MSAFRTPQRVPVRSVVLFLGCCPFGISDVDCSAVFEKALAERMFGENKVFVKVIEEPNDPSTARFL